MRANVVMRGILALFYRKPVKHVRTERQQIRQLADARKLGAPEQFDRRASLEPRQVEFHVWHEARQVGDHQNLLVAKTADKGQHPGIVRRQRFDGATAKRPELFAQRNQAPNPPQERMPVAFLRFDVDSLIMVLVINDYREDQALRVAGGEAGVTVTAPLHWRAHSVAVTQI